MSHLQNHVWFAMCVPMFQLSRLSRRGRSEAEWAGQMGYGLQTHDV